MSDPLDFEFVSLSDAKKVSEEAQANIAVNRKPETVQEEQDWTKVRQPQIAFDLQLQQETAEWLLGLPNDIRPLHLAKKFPRVANNIARAWRRPAICDDVFEELMIDHRGTRQGFPEEVAMEIATLAEYYRAVAYPKKDDVWTQR